MYFETLDLLSTFLTAYSFLFIAMFLYFFLSYLKRNSKFKRVEFTQGIIEKNKNLLDEYYIIINSLMEINLKENHLSNNHIKDMTYENKMNAIVKFKRTIRYFNVLAEGIEKGIYDEEVIKVNYQFEMKTCYKLSFMLERYDYFMGQEVDMFMALEFLLKKWDSKVSKKKVNY